MKKIIFLFIFVTIMPLFSISQNKFSSEEKYHIVRSSDSSSVLSYCGECFDDLYASYGRAYGMDTIRRYVDTLIVFFNSQDTANQFSVYNQYNREESLLKSHMWSVAMASRLMLDFKQYNLTPAKRRATIRKNFITFCSNPIKIQYFE